jgi:HEAT repeat protein
MEALVKIGTDDVTDALSELRNDGDADVRLRAAEALGRIGGNKAEGLLIPFLSDTDSTVRYCAALQLANSKNNQAESVLIKALTDTLQYDYRKSIIDALVDYGDEGAVDALSAVIQKLSDSEEINYCVLALGRIGSQSAVPALTKLLETHVAERACTALGEIGGEKAEKALEKHLFGMFIINADSSLVMALAKIGGEWLKKR